MKTRSLRLLAALAALALLLAGCGRQTLQDKAAEALGLDLSAGTVLAESDTHGGFHGDGAACLKLAFADGALAEAIAADPAWSPLPLSDTATALVWGLTTEQDGTSMTWGPYLTGDDGQPLVDPAVETGWYRLIDRHSEAADPADESGVLGRGSLNFTLALYDADRNELYYMTLDT